jgi:hypothetical protein
MADLAGVRRAILVRDQLIWVPVISASPRQRAPAVLDTVYLTDRRIRVGPWHVSAIAKEPRVEHPRDFREIHLWGGSIGGSEAIRWLQLRRKACL